MNNNPAPSAKTETASLGLNQLIMFGCVLFLGWRISELLALLSIELLVSGLLWYYVEWYWGLRLRPNRDKSQLNKFFLRLFLQIATLSAALYLVLRSAEAENNNLWTVEMGLFALVFAAMPFMILAIWQKKGYIPTIELLPAQIRILLTYGQLFFVPLLCLLGFIAIIYRIENWQAAGLICGLKLLFDLYTYPKINV